MVVTHRFVPIESRPFVTLDWFYDDGGFTSLDLEAARNAIVRVRYTATEEQQRRIDVGLLRRELLDAGAFRVTVEPEIVREDRARVNVDSDSLTELDALQLYLDANSVNGSRGAAMAERTKAYLETSA